MSEYKRLTKRTANGKATRIKTSTSNYIGTIYEEELILNQEIIDRLAELEDKIEAGTLIELPCKVIIERVIDEHGNFIKTKKAQAFNGRYGILYIDKEKYTLPLIDICTEKSYNREAAEARLKELEEKEK